MRLAFDYAKRNNIPTPFNESKKNGGRKWFDNFCARNKFSLRTPEKLSAARVKAMSEESAHNFFNNLKEMYQKYDFPGDRVFNMDEAGISTVPSKMSKVVSPTGKKNRV